MTPVEACKGCGGLFPFLPRGICADCIDLRERRYGEVREWLLDNPGASILQAAEATDVPEPLIMEFLREGRLEFVGAAAATSPAEEDLKQRIREDLAARAAEAAATQAPSRRPAAGPSLGMRSRGS
ncbi:MAG: hypothetical protein AB7V62_17760 [Thermoleophilia bacterium]